MELGKAQDETQLEAALKKIAINECCTLVYTVSTCYYCSKCSFFLIIWLYDQLFYFLGESFSVGAGKKT